MYKPKKRSKLPAASENKRRPRRVFTYRRVSDKDQADGQSLAEQDRVNEMFCRDKNLEVVGVFQDVQTAAKTGRNDFNRMVKKLRKEDVDGIVFHKVDRSARNFNDWQTISELMDEGYYIAFAGERLESSDLGGRLAMDFLVTFAVHYIRNLRQETHKGLRGRINQGLWPWAAPLGYKDRPRNSGDEQRCKKFLDKKRAPFIRTLFELYVSRNYTVRELADEISARGLRTRTGKAVCFQKVCKILDNPFYAGLLPYDGELFPGKHEPIIPISLWDRTQELRKQRTVEKTTKHRFTFRRLLHCEICGSTMVGELKKGHVYYRCHHRGAHETNTIRETAVVEQLSAKLRAARLSPSVAKVAKSLLKDISAESTSLQKKREATERIERGKIEAKKQRALDAYLAGALDVEALNEVRNKAVSDLAALDAASRAESARPKSNQVLELLERLDSAVFSQKTGKQRELLGCLFSNLSVKAKEVSTQPRKWFGKLLDLQLVLQSAHSTESARTFVGALEDIAAEPECRKFVESLRHPDDNEFEFFRDGYKTATATNQAG